MERGLLRDHQHNFDIYFKDFEAFYFMAKSYIIVFKYGRNILNPVPGQYTNAIFEGHFTSFLLMTFPWLSNTLTIFSVVWKFLKRHSHVVMYQLIYKFFK